MKKSSLSWKCPIFQWISRENLNAGFPSQRFFSHEKYIRGLSGENKSPKKQPSIESLGWTLPERNQRRLAAALGERAESAWEAEGIWRAGKGLEKWGPTLRGKAWNNEEKRTNHIQSEKNPITGLPTTATRDFTMESEHAFGSHSCKYQPW